MKVPRVRLPALVVLGLWLGLVYGLLEALEFTLLGLVPGALAWRNGNAPRVLWFAPLFYGVVFGALGAVAATLARLLPRVPWGRVLVFALVGLGMYCGARLQGEIFSVGASLVLALGAGVQAARVYSRQPDVWQARVRRSVPLVVALVAILALAELGFAWGRERWALRALPHADERAPNVLLLVLDTLRADHVSTYGYRRPTTPRMDALGRQGVVFERAYANSCWTLPSHASLFTGRLVSEHRAGEQRRPFLDSRFPTLAERFADAGYATGGFVANTFWCGRQTGLDRGFVRYEDFYGSVADAAVRTVLGRMLAYEVLPHAGFIDIPGRKSAGDINASFLEWLDSVGDRPFFAFLNYMDVHGPYLPPPEYLGVFGGPTDPERPREILLGAITDATKVPEPELLKAWIDRYDESLLYLDAQIGALADQLARRGLLDRTILVITSDHGEAWGEHDLIYHGNSLYLHQTRVPLIVRYPPAIERGGRMTHAVGLDRVPATIAELAGLSSHPFPGTSAMRASGDEPVLAEVGRRPGVPSNWPTSKGWLKAVFDDRWQLIVGERSAPELFDVVGDERQIHNLAGSPGHVSTVERLRGDLEEALAGRGAPISAGSGRSATLASHDRGERATQATTGVDSGNQRVQP